MLVPGAVMCGLLAHAVELAGDSCHQFGKSRSGNRRDGQRPKAATFDDLPYLIGLFPNLGYILLGKDHEHRPFTQRLAVALELLIDLVEVFNRVTFLKTGKIDEMEEKVGAFNMS